MHQDYKKNKELRILIRKTLELDSKALIKLKDYWCGGGAGCYDLGFVITQIAYKIGENQFVGLLKEVSKKDQLQIESLIKVGLEYGDNDYDGKMDDKRIKDEFPHIYELIHRSADK